MSETDIKYWLKGATGWLLILLFCTIPVVYWFSITPLSEAFYDIQETFLTLSKLTGLIGFVLYSINMVLTLRQRWLEELFNGLNRVYIAHHITGGIALSFLLFHPLLIALQYLDFKTTESYKNAAQSLLPQWMNFGDSFYAVIQAFAQNSGIIAFIGMVVLLMITFYAKLPYRIWLFTHRFLGVAFLFAGLHVILISSDVSQSAFLTIYMLFWIILGLGAFVYKTLLGNVLVKRVPYRVENTMVVAGNTVGIYLSPIEKRIDFIPGQFIFIRFLWSTKDGIIREIHPFSIASEPSEKGLIIYVRALGDFTNSLKHLKIGTMAEIEGAFGKFSYTHFKDQPQVWIAGGIGITPFLSMARSFDESCPPVDLFYSVQKREELVDQAALAEYLPAHFQNFHYHPYVTTEMPEFLSATYISENIKDLLSREIFICGPPPMMKALRAQLRTLGVKNSKIHSEEFTMS